MDPIVIGALIGAGTSLLGSIFNKSEAPKNLAESTPLGGQGQGITSINLQDIGQDTENIAEDIKFNQEDFEVAQANTSDNGILNALRDKLGAKNGKPISSLENMTVEELLAFLNMDELTDVGSNISMEDVMATVSPDFEMVKPSIDTSNVTLSGSKPNTANLISKSMEDAKKANERKIATDLAIAGAQASEGSGKLTPDETALLIQGLASLVQLVENKDRKPSLGAASAPRFSYQAPSGGITLESIGMNMGGATSKVLARPMFKGNPVVGPGGPKDDIIPVLASDGEFMLSKAAVDHAGGGNHALGIERLKAFNNKGNQRYG